MKNKTRPVLDISFIIWHYTFRQFDGGCSSGVELQIVDLAVVGSKPITHPWKSPLTCVSGDFFFILGL
jgi:hypothetical protein